jgi:hypothetical protein
MSWSWKCVKPSAKIWPVSWKTFLHDWLLNLSGRHHMHLSPNWTQVRTEAQVTAQRRVWEGELKRQTRLKRYERGHYRAVYIRNKREARQAKIESLTHRTRYWKVLDRDFIGEAH